MLFEQWREKFAASRFGSRLLLPARVQTIRQDEELEQTRQALYEAQQMAQQYLDLYTQAYGELSRMKQRAEQMRREYIRQGQQSILKELIPVFDDLWRASQQRPTDLASHQWVIGIELITRQLTATLEALSLCSAYGEPGQPFNPQWYEAVDVEVRSDLAEGTIVKVHRQGYVLGKRMLRPALVTVSALKEPASPASAQATR